MVAGHATGGGRQGDRRTPEGGSGYYQPVVRVPRHTKTDEQGAIRRAAMKPDDLTVPRVPGS